MTGLISAGSGFDAAATTPARVAAAPRPALSATGAQDRPGRGEDGDAAPVAVRVFADLLLPEAPAAPAAAAAALATATPGILADPAEAPSEPADEAAEATPGDLLALLAGHWLDTRTAATPAPGGNAGPTPPPQQSSRPTAGAAAIALPAISAALTDARPAVADLPLATPAHPAATAATTGTAAAERAAATAWQGKPDAAATGAGTVAAIAALAAPSATAGPEPRDGARVEAVPTIDGPAATLAAAAPAVALRPQATALASPLAMPAGAEAGFDDGFGSHVAWMAEQRVGHAEIRLNPEHVGPIEVRIELEGDQVHAEFRSTHAEVRQAIEASLPRLRDLLGQHGLQLGQADVGQRRDGRDGGAGDAPRRGEPPAGGEPGQPSAPPRSARVRGLLDAYA